MVAELKAEAKMFTWVVRGAGFLAMFFGLMLLMAPLAILGSIIPLLGNIIEAGTALISLLLALAGSSLVIALAWVWYRPLIGISLLAITGLGVWMTLKRLRRAGTPATSLQPTALPA
jgi:Transmembrane protein 43